MEVNTLRADYLEYINPCFVDIRLHSVLCEQVIARNNILCIILFVLVVFFFEFETFTVYDTKGNSSSGEFLLQLITSYLIVQCFKLLLE